MATKTKSNKKAITKRGKKKGGVLTGSPITIGGGGGLIPEKLFIEFTTRDWVEVAAPDPTKTRFVVVDPNTGVKKVKIKKSKVVKVHANMKNGPDIDITFS